MNLSNLSKIESKNISNNSSFRSLSRFEEQNNMIQLLDNQLNVRIKLFIFIYNRINKILILLIKSKMILFKIEKTKNLVLKI